MLNCQKKQEFIQLIEALTYQGLHLWRLHFVSKCHQSTLGQGVNIQVGCRLLWSVWALVALSDPLKPSFGVALSPFNAFDLFVNPFGNEKIFMKIPN